MESTGARADCRRRPRGFTLMELLVALLILSLALISLSQLYLAGMWTVQKARYLSLATQRAQAELERANDLGILSLLNGPSEASYPISEYTWHEDGRGVDFTEDSLPNSQGTLTWQNWPTGETGSDQLLKVDIILTWKGAARSRSQVHVTTLLTNKR